MPQLDIVGIMLVAVAIVYAFWKRHDRMALALIIVLLVLLAMLGYL